MEAEDDGSIPKLELDGPIPIPTAGEVFLAVGGVAGDADSAEAMSLTVSPLKRSEVPDCIMIVKRQFLRQVQKCMFMLNTYVIGLRVDAKYTFFRVYASEKYYLVKNYTGIALTGYLLAVYIGSTIYKLNLMFSEEDW